MSKRLLMSLFTFVFLTCFTRIHGQEDGDQIVFGKYQKIHSIILGEDRTLLIYLPRQYNQTHKKYPVVYQLDGWKFQYLRGIASVERLQGENKMPEAILVAIANTDRDRDMLPFQTVFHRTGGGADRFIRFLTEELIPFVDDRYRTTSYKVLIGFSNSGLFTIYCLATKPEAFDAYVACSPSIAWDFDYFKERMMHLLNQRNSLNKTFSIVYGGKEGNAHYGEQYYYDMSRVHDLIELIEDNTPEDFRWSLKEIEEGRHVPYGCIYEGLRTVFQDWEPVTHPEIIPFGGFFNKMDSIAVQIKCKQGTVHFTLDGTEPTRESTVYTEEIIIDGPATLKAKVFYKNIDEGRTASAEFQQTLPLKSEKMKSFVRGLTYQYYEDYYWYRLPDFDTVHSQETGIVESIHIKCKKREEGFALRFKGYIDIKKTGVYRFYLESNDESKLFIGNRVVVHKEPRYILPVKCGQIVLEKGKHRLEVQYVGPPFRRKLAMNVYMEGVGIEKQEIPKEILYHD